MSTDEPRAGAGAPGSLAAPGPLVVSRTNPRYFAVAADDGVERAVYLTGSHIWNNLQDGLGPGGATRRPRSTTTTPNWRS